MRVTITIALILVAISCCALADDSDNSQAKPDKIPHPPLGVDVDVWSHVHKLTVEERIGQMTQLSIEQVFNTDHKALSGAKKVNTTLLEQLLHKYHIGAWVASPNSNNAWTQPPTALEWAEIVQHVNVFSIKSDGVPTIFAVDHIHGANYVSAATLFPHQLNMAATFNTNLIRTAASITAKDTRASSIAWVWSPNLEVALHPAWPRMHETFGECPHVVSRMGGAIIEGLQGRMSTGVPNIASPTNVAATFKYFLGSGATRDGHMHTESWLPDRQLLEYVLPPFQDAIQKYSATTGMLSSADVNGVPVSTNSALTVTLLRESLGFNGTLVSDWDQFETLSSIHRIGASMKDAISLSMRTSSLDVGAMPPGQLEKWFEAMVQLVREGVVPNARLNIAVAHMLQLKKDLGLAPSFPFVELMTNQAVLAKEQEAAIRSVGSQVDRDCSLEVAHESIVLLKNDGTLPILLHKSWLANLDQTSLGQRKRNTSNIKKILVVGPTAHSMTRLTGSTTFFPSGAAKDQQFAVGSSIFEAIKRLTAELSVQPDEISVTYESGVDIDGSYTDAAMKQTLLAAQQADLVIACLGEDTYSTSHDGDISSLSLPWGQQNLINQLTRLPKRSSTGDAAAASTSENEQEDVAKGEQANILHNKKVILVLVQSRPRLMDIINLQRVRAVVHAGLPGPEGGQAVADIIFGMVNPSGKLPFTYPSKPLELPLTYYHKFNQQSSFHPAFEFGAGLSYTQFQYSKLTLSHKEIDPTAGNVLTITVDVKNTGELEGKEAVLCFLTDVFRVVTPEVKRLRGFEKINLLPGETKTVHFSLGYDDWSFIGVAFDRRTEAGEFRVQVGDQFESFMLKEGQDDLFDTEVILTRKMIKKWWKEVKQELTGDAEWRETHSGEERPVDDQNSVFTNNSLVTAAEAVVKDSETSSRAVMDNTSSHSSSSLSDEASAAAKAAPSNGDSAAATAAPGGHGWRWVIFFILALMGGVIGYGVMRERRPLLGGSIQATEDETDGFLNAHSPQSRPPQPSFERVPDRSSSSSSSHSSKSKSSSKSSSSRGSGSHNSSGSHKATSNVPDSFWDEGTVDYEEGLEFGRASSGSSKSSSNNHPFPVAQPVRYTHSASRSARGESEDSYQSI